MAEIKCEICGSGPYKNKESLRSHRFIKHKEAAVSVESPPVVQPSGNGHSHGGIWGEINLLAREGELDETAPRCQHCGKPLPQYTSLMHEIEQRIQAATTERVQPTVAVQEEAAPLPRQQSNRAWLWLVAALVLAFIAGFGGYLVYAGKLEQWIGG